LGNDEAALFVAVSVAAGVVAQWPVGWLADRFNRVVLIRINAISLTVLAIPLWGWLDIPFQALLGLGAAIGILQFTLYPLGTALANDNVDPERRVGLSAILYIMYGLGACIGPLLVGVLMNSLSSALFYMFVAACSASLIFVVRPQKVTGEHLSPDAPTEFVPMPESSVAVVLDPRVDISSDISHDPVIEDEGPEMDEFTPPEPDESPSGETAAESPQPPK
jgi:MFS family permease